MFTSSPRVVHMAPNSTRSVDLTARTGAWTADHAAGIALVRRLRESLRNHEPNLVAPHQQCLVLEALWPRCENCMYERRH